MDQDGHAAPALETSSFGPPLVTVIVSCYNYGRFLRAAIQSVYAQRYPCVQCIVVDDASEDSTADVIKELKGVHQDLLAIRNERNLGQSLSLVRGLEKAEGTHVIFLDADDYLHPDCVAAHVDVHLSLRVPVGFTSVDMFQIVDERVVTVSAPCFSGYIRERKGRAADLTSGLRFRFGQYELPKIPESRIHYVAPTAAGGWPWSPTSGNCFRRDALELVIGNPQLADLRTCTDCYLLRGVGLLTGSVLIDEPLFGYRVHGQNDFLRGLNLNRIVPYQNQDLVRKSNEATRILLDYLIDNFLPLAERLEARSYLCDALDALGNVHPPLEGGTVKYMRRRLASKRAEIGEAIGSANFSAWLNSLGRPRARSLTFPWISRTGH